MFSQYWVANVPGSTITAAQSVVIQGLGDVTATAAEINAGVDGLTATSNEINNKVDGSTNYLATTTATASEVIMSTNSGRIHFLGNTQASATQAMLLPAEAAGLNYQFVYVGAAETTANFTIGTEAAANFFVGGVEFQDLDGDAVSSVYSDGNSNSLITLVTPGAGTVVNVHCNGTSWYVWGKVVSNTTPTIADT